MMAPVLARAAAAIILKTEFPADLLAQGIVERDLSPARLTCRRRFQPDETPGGRAQSVASFKKARADSA
jgi:hypothetical protein